VSKAVLHLARFLLISAAMVAVLPAPTFAHKGEAHPQRTPVPNMVTEGDGKCIAPPEEMRRNHMEMLKHQRDRTLRQGIRGEPASLNACIECHASKKTGSVLGKGDFCESCHAYAAVKLDCWDCHQPKAKFKAAGAKP
jgi:hypothetical protein